MRIQGRLLRASNLAERRVLKSIGLDVIRVRRGVNPFMVARRLRKLAVGLGGDMPELRAILKSPVRPLPDSTPEPRDGERAA
jgi:hypothetical protein